MRIAFQFLRVLCSGKPNLLLVAIPGQINQGYGDLTEQNSSYTIYRIVNAIVWPFSQCFRIKILIFSVLLNLNHVFYSALEFKCIFIIMLWDPSIEHFQCIIESRPYNTE